jgi:hypothetical protein
MDLNKLKNIQLKTDYCPFWVSALLFLPLLIFVFTAHFYLITSYWPSVNLSFKVPFYYVLFTFLLSFMTLPFCIKFCHPRTMITLTMIIKLFLVPIYCFVFSFLIYVILISSPVIVRISLHFPISPLHFKDFYLIEFLLLCSTSTYATFAILKTQLFSRHGKVAKIIFSWIFIFDVVAALQSHISSCYRYRFNEKNIPFPDPNLIIKRNALILLFMQIFGVAFYSLPSFRALALRNLVYSESQIFSALQIFSAIILLVALPVQAYLLGFEYDRIKKNKMIWWPVIYIILLIPLWFAEYYGHGNNDVGTFFLLFFLTAAIIAIPFSSGFFKNSDKIKDEEIFYNTKQS